LVNAADYGMPVFFMMLLMVSGVVGYVLLLCSRRVGYVLILLAVGIMMLEDFGFNLTGILTGIGIGSGSYPFETYVSGLFASLLSAVNPTITGLVLLRAWKAGPVSAGSAPMFIAGPAAGGPVAPVASVAPAAAPIPSFTPAAAPTSSAPAQPSAPAPAPKPKPKPQPVQAAKGPGFKPYTGSGVCDVCNKPLSSCKAYIVPNDVFYRSPKYRNWVKNNSLSALMGVPINDAYFAQMQARDHSQGSAVCEDCVSMFE
jgi:hypothetical protein